MKIKDVFEKIFVYKKRYQAPENEEEAKKQIETNKRIKEKFLSIIDPIGKLSSTPFFKTTF